MKASVVPTATLKSKEKNKEKRKSKGNSKEVNNTNKDIPNSQFYTGPEVSVVQSAGSVQPVFELRQEVNIFQPKPISFQNFLLTVNFFFF